MFYCFVDDLLAKINHIAELKENITDVKTKLAQVQLLFESARSERNAFQRDLQATLEDRDDLRERYRVKYIKLNFKHNFECIFKCCSDRLLLAKSNS